ncbi:MAG: DUF11 domain-containing protein [Anaerolineae bacterium]|nr:DUF11 domain-containing protein [Anaerolineae bacterium]
MSFNEGYISLSTVVKRVAFLMLIAALFTGAWPSQAASIAYTVTGVAYYANDPNSVYNGDEPGVGSVTITAFDNTGKAVAQAVTSNDLKRRGTYTLNIPVINQSLHPQVRVEITTLPAEAAGGPSRHTVAFVDRAARVNFGLFQQAGVCPANVDLVTSCFVYGNQLTGPNSTLPVVVSFPYDAGCFDANFDGVCDPGTGASFDAPTAHALMVQANRVGSTWGIAYQGTTRAVFAASFLKRHTGFGPGGPGAIYRIDRATGAATVFATLPAGADPHPQPPNENTCPLPAPAGDCWFYDSGAYPLIGKMSLGGMDISEDQSSLFVMNLSDRTVYQLNATSGATIATFPFPLNQADCTGDPGDIRPFAVRVNRGQVYVGATCTGESLGDPAGRARLRLYVYTLAPATGAYTQVFNYGPIGGLNTYRRTRFWRAWSSNPAAFPQPDPLPTPCDFCTNPQPWLTGLTFDTNGDMVLGIRDRFGDQGGYRGGNPVQGVAGLNTVTAAGDTLRACSNGAGGWVMENAGVCGGVTSQGATFNDPAATGGPYTGALPPNTAKFYYQDNHDTGPAVSMGAVLQLPGQPEVIVTAIDPKYGSPGDPGTSSAGTLRFNNTTGARTRAYRIYDRSGAPLPPVFGKANGLGDLKAFCDVVLPAAAAPAAPAVSAAVAVPDIIINKTADQRIVSPGDNVTYTITVFNKGGAPAPNVIITDPVPSPLRVLSAAASQGTFGIAGNTVTFFVGTVNPGQTVTLTIRANVPSNAQAPQDVYNIIISTGTPKATEAIRITRGELPSTGEHPDPVPTPTSGWLLLVAAVGGLGVTVLLLRLRHRQAHKG